MSQNQDPPRDPSAPRPRAGDSAAPVAPLRRILGDYKLLREIGRGGMGVVWLARDIALARDVALKVLQGDGSIGEGEVLRLRREAALLGRLSHPSLVKVFAFGSDRDQHYIAMQYVAGIDLDLALRLSNDDDSADRSALPPPLARDFRGACVRGIADVAAALGAAHAAGIVHRDVKPSNVLIDSDGRFLLADFGLAKALDAPALTRTSQVVGTPHYMSPERYRGGDLSPATDVYALGAVLYQCLTSRRPFDATNPEELLDKVLHHEVAPPRRIDPSIPRELETIVATCLEKDPASRYADGAALAADLERFLRDEPIAARPASPLTAAYRRMRRRRMSALVGVAVGLLALVLAGLWLRDRSQSSRELETRRFDEAIAAARAMLDRDDPDAAYAALSDLIAEQPQRIDLRFERADLALRLKRWPDAASEFEAIVTAANDEATILAAELGRGLAAPIAAGTPPQPAGIAAEAATSGRAAFYVALRHQSRRELEAAESAARIATELDPSLIEAFYTLGALRFRRGDFTGAKEALLAYDRVRNRADVANYLGWIEMDAAAFDAARTRFQDYVSRRPQDVVGWNNLAAAYLALAAAYDQNKWHDQAEQHRTQARAAIEKAKAIDASYFLLAYNEAVLEVQEGATEAGEATFARAVAGCGNDGYWLLRMEVWFARQLDWARRGDRAIALLEAALERHPWMATEPYFVYARAEVLLNAGRAGDAKELLDAALAGALAGNAALLELRDKTGE
jgi:tetratricopeptide (TPR) repeat protein